MLQNQPRCRRAMEFIRWNVDPRKAPVLANISFNEFISFVESRASTPIPVEMSLSSLMRSLRPLKRASFCSSRSEAEYCCATLPLKRLTKLLLRSCGSFFGAPFSLMYPRGAPPCGFSFGELVRRGVCSHAPMGARIVELYGATCFEGIADEEPGSWCEVSSACRSGTTALRRFMAH